MSGCLGSPSEAEKCREWRRKSVKLREGEFLHGELLVEIQEAKDLPDTDNFLFNIKRCFGQEKDVTDPYVAVFLDHTKIITTSVIYNNLCPQWNEFFRVSVCHYVKKLSFRIKDQDELGTDNVGEVCIAVSDLINKPGMSIHGWQTIIDQNSKAQGQLFIKVLYRPYRARGVQEFECEDCYFPLRAGNRVTLFSCVRNVDVEHLIPLSPQEEQLLQQADQAAVCGGNSLGYTPPSLWIDLYKSIVASEKFIYITGWSVNTKIKLLRGDDWTFLKTQEELDCSSLTLGELLRYKAERGVRVLVMIWGETTAIMGTHDTETENYFKANLGYSHHQKAVILDGPAIPGQKRTNVSESNANGNHKSTDFNATRRIIAYVGGIDLTDGRFDSPEHPLYRTLTSLHLGDFYQPCEPSVKPLMGPRLPWQDIHAKVEGPAARDIMINFIERWGKERPFNTRLLIQDVSLPEYDFSPLAELADDEAWNVQVFRSITSDSARFQLENETSFTTKKGRSVDNSIARAYTAAIRKAKRFIYIENQYFMGSSYGWLDDQDVHCYNVIPMEITQKICESIEQGSRFTVYIVIPLHPEGIPTDNAIQEMLFWQRHTMQMMYTRIAHALHSKGMLNKAHPTDYLAFFCLGKKERLCDIPVGDLQTPMIGTRAAKLRKNLRSMIYVHSKLMVVDDAYVLTGSANINQRSLDGDRDSELAIGGYQPSHVLSENNAPRGDIFKFRMALWKEHMSKMESVFTDPSSERCMRAVRDAALSNWLDYENRDGDPKGHLLLYPVDANVDVDDDVPVVRLTVRTKNKCFPDVKKAKILGKQARSIPNKLTT